MRASALWLPWQVEDLDAATEYYTDHIGLSEVDRFEDGVVLRAAEVTYLELTTPGPARPAPMAFELASPHAVDEEFRLWQPDPADLLRPPGHYPRGHYGFELRGPGGATIMIWSER
ncbi:hypothetical protein GCM10010174_77000 [Kutzneria viridogrisea]|uniref:VOC domain-containing protein n=2 Tax=Kutzneria TaxID=43356 RepID=W5W5W4_9PSEU|nr:VOC family protein [Kutzneria albida]AHH96297.1 hypothetical protein KALB_2929 [Kutzneria albida DSM 43870]MBA8928488.1 catechol 2,3-dioxygenase-like lactoylglutathione lyase family enzyme [Kutzneria viridogrisea]